MTGTAEVRRHLSRFLKRVQAGERVVITDRGAPIAELVPYRPGFGTHAAEARLAYLVSLGVVSVPKLPLAAVIEPVRPVTADTPSPAADAVARDRRDSS